MKVYHSSKQSDVICKLCGKVFKLQRSLVLHHKATHSSKEKETCTVCQQEYFHLKDLNRLERVLSSPVTSVILLLAQKPTYINTDKEFMAFTLEDVEESFE